MVTATALQSAANAEAEALASGDMVSSARKSCSGSVLGLVPGISLGLSDKSSPQSSEVNSVVMLSISQVRTLRFRHKNLIQGHAAGLCWGWDLNPHLCLQSPCS